MTKQPQRYGSRDNPIPGRGRQSNSGNLRRTNVFNNLMALYRKCEPLVSRFRRSRFREVIQLASEFAFVWECSTWCSKHGLPAFLAWLHQFV